MASFSKQTTKTIQQAFDEFHERNPQVYDSFKELAFEAINARKKKISSKMIINVIRWEVFLQTEDKTLVDIGDGLVSFKINDAYTRRYARLFANDYPEHEDKFNFRELRS